MASFLVGIAGGTGSGKTTIAKKLAAGLPRGVVAIIEHDAYYRDRPDLSYEERCKLNFDHPDSLETELLIEHLSELKRGRAVDIPSYDFTSHARSRESRRLEPRPVVVVEGILVLVDELLRDLFDIKLFVDTDADLRVFRRIRRDIEQRGRSFQSIRRRYYRTVRPMHLQFVDPSKRCADVVIPEGGDNRVALDLILAKLGNVVEAPQSKE